DFADTGKAIRVRVPNATQVATSLCGPQLKTLPSTAQSIVMGSVTLLGDTLRAKGGSVVAEWTEGDRDDFRWRETKIDAAGNFRMGGVRWGRALVFRATSDTGSAETSVLTIPRDRRFARMDFVVDPATPATGIFSGIVVAGANDAPVVGAEVVIPKVAK